MMNKYSLDELRQRMEVVISTYFNMFGCVPDINELYDALGEEYMPVLAEFSPVSA